jgi:hypothetical protein
MVAPSSTLRSIMPVRSNCTPVGHRRDLGLQIERIAWPECLRLIHHPGDDLVVDRVLNEEARAGDADLPRQPKMPVVVAAAARSRWASAKIFDDLPPRLWVTEISDSPTLRAMVGAMAEPPVSGSCRYRGGG